MGVVIRTYISGLGVVDLPLGHPLLEENAQARLALKEKDDTILGCTVAILYFTIGIILGAGAAFLFLSGV